MSSCRLSLRPAEVRRADALLVKARAASPRGSIVHRADLLHAALDRGLDALALELARRVAHPHLLEAASAAPVEDDAPPSSERRPRRR